MQYFIGIIPPVEYQQQIIEFQKCWPNNRLPDVVEPHVTLKAQGGLTADLAWVDRVKDICSKFPSFDLSIVEPRFFDNSILYLGVESKQIVELHKRLVDTVSPAREVIQRYFELDLFTPHLTLGKTYWGLTESELQEMQFKAGGVLCPFPTFNVKYIRIYREFEKDKYEPFRDIPLA